MSGLGAPARTAAPELERTKSTRLPATSLPSLTSASITSGVVITKSAGAPSRTLPGNTEPENRLTVTLWPLARSNMGTSSSSTSRIAVEAMTVISAALAALAISGAARPTAGAVAFSHMTSSLRSFWWSSLCCRCGALQPPGCQQGGRLGRQEFHQRLGGIRLLGRDQHAGREGRQLLQRGRQRTDQLDAGDRQELADLLHPDFRFAFGHHLADRGARLRQHDLSLHLVGDAPSCQHGRELDAAPAHPGLGDRFGR